MSQKQTKDSNVGAWIGGGVAALTVVGVLVAGICLMVYECNQASTWKKTKGRVTVCEVYQCKRVSSSRSKRPMFGLELFYVYSVGDKSYTGCGLRYNRKGSQRSMEKLAQRYPVGKAIDVYYNPAKPSKATLTVGISFLSILFTAIGLLFTVLAVVIVRVVLKSRAKKRQSASAPEESEQPAKPKQDQEDISVFVDWLATQAEEQTGAPIKSEPMAMKRIETEAANAVELLKTQPEVEIKLPFIAADASGPKHFSIVVSKDGFR